MTMHCWKSSERYQWGNVAGRDAGATMRSVGPASVPVTKGTEAGKMPVLLVACVVNAVLPEFFDYFRC